MSKSFYTSVVQWGNNLLVRSIRDGLHQKQKVDFYPTLYTTNTKTISTPTEWTTLHGIPAYEIKPGNINDCKEFIKTYEGVESFNIFGQTNYALQYISDNHPDDIVFDSEFLKIVSIDIETATEADAFPEPKYAAEEILLITIQDNKSKEYKTFGSRPYTGENSGNYILCKNEKDLLRVFVTHWQCNVPDIITGWNIDLFDIPYLVNRIKKVLGDDYKKLSPWNSVIEKKTNVRGTEEILFDIVGVSSLDYYALYKKYTYATQESYKLDHIAFIELGENKLDHSQWATFKEFYQNNWELFVDYNIKDVDLVDKLEDKLRLIELHLTMAYTAKINYNDAFSPVKLWDAIIYNDLLNKKIVIPNSEHHSKGEAFEGAYVKDPLKGMHKWVASFDLASLYPHLIMQYNISPETITDTRLNLSIDGLLKKDPIPETGLSVSANGWCYSKDKQGFLPSLMETMYNNRTVHKKAMLKCEQDYEEDKTKKYLLKEISRLTNLQMALKIALNSAYGALGSPFFRYYDLRMAESITLSGQLSIKWIANTLNQYMNTAMKTVDKDYVIAIDTDSVYLTLENLVEQHQPDKTTEERIQFMDKICGQVITPIIEKSYSELAVYMNAFQNKMQMKREVLADKGVWCKKKKYILRVHNSEGVQYDQPKLKIMGLEIVKSSTPSAIRDKLKSTIGVILDGTNSDLIKFIDSARKEFMSIPIEDIAFPRGVNGVNEYSSNVSIYSKGCPIHVRGALLYNHLIKELNLTHKYQPIKTGDKIKFIYLKKPNTIKENVIAFQSELPVEFGLHKYVDYDQQFEKVFLDALDNIIEPMGWHLVEKATLDDFFG
jgi:DNA polymerase elongation subunit (family B)